MKAVSIATLLVFFILCLAIPILLISFSLSLSVSKHHNFLLSTYEFIVLAKSNRVAIFFVFQVLFIATVFGSFRPCKEDAECYQVENDAKEEAAAVNDDHSFHEEFYFCDCGDCEEGNETTDYGSDGYDEDNDDDWSDDDVNSEEFFGGEIDSDLERRTEDFIAKVTRKWREELMYEKLVFMAGIESQSSTSS